MYFDDEKAKRAINFIKHLKHTKGKWAGVPFTMLPWQEQAVSDIFGTVRENGFRKYNTAYIEIPKKMGKSELGAAIGLYGLAADNEVAAEVYGCAGDRQQASIIFDVAVDMVDQSPALKKKTKLILSQKRMVYVPTRSYYQVLSAEAYTKHGFNISMCIFDELHSQPNRALYDVMTDGAGDAREQPLWVILTTAGDDPDKVSIGSEVHKTAQDIMTGAKEDPTFYSMIYGIEPENKRIWMGREYKEYKKEIDWKDEKVWRAVNPSIDHTVPIDKVKDQFTRALGNPAKEKNFRWLRLNEWVNLKTQKWLSLDFWDHCKDKIDLERLKGRPCYGGLDLSSKIDMTAFVLVFPPDDINQKWIVLPRMWIPDDTLHERASQDKVPYDLWKQQGYLKTTPGNVIDYNYIEDEIMDLASVYDLRMIGFDPWNAMQTATNLGDEGMVMLEVRQGARSMSAPMKEIEQLVRGRKLIHSGHPVLRWNVGNVEIKMDDNENIRPVKGKSTERIDGLVALINAFNIALQFERSDGSEIIKSEEWCM